VLDDSKSILMSEDGWVETRINIAEDSYFFGYGREYLECLKDFFHLCGATPMIPRYSLGNWWSRFHRYTEEEIHETITSIRFNWRNKAEIQISRKNKYDIISDKRDYTFLLVGFANTEEIMMLKILAIGNSFSEDSTTYLYRMAESSGIEIKVVNLFIGGCSLERHWNNVCEDKADYDYQLNGKSTGKLVGIKEILVEDDWDIVTMQQCSGYSGILDSYYPYIINLSNYIKLNAPNAKQLIHQTWAYEIDSVHDHFSFYHNDQEEMYQALINCYDIVSKELSLDIIPFGEVIQKLRTISPFEYYIGGKSLCRDGFHMDYIYGRYALAATWFEYVVKGNILENSFIPAAVDDTEVKEEDLTIIKQCIHQLIQH